CARYAYYSNYTWFAYW
nr:immunoglobulin heavy chain junction region [Mus musculus]